MAEPFLGQLMCVGFNFAPRGWATCDGQMMSVGQNTALFSLLGTQYGGNGTTTFGLPDLRGRVSLHQGSGPGLSNYTIGEAGGVESVTLSSQQMPLHNHAINASNSDASDQTPGGNFPSGGGAYNNSPPPRQTMNQAMCGNAGGNQPHENRQPYLVLNWIIALEGIYPSRN